MKAWALKTLLRYAVGWSTVVLFAVLLTFIFSFLGAFFCAALAGMMLGSFKVPRWQIAAVSGIFPAVLFALLRGGGAELRGSQVVVLSVLCFGTFWLTYFVVRAVVWYERKGQPNGHSAKTASGTGPTKTFPPPTQVNGSAGVANPLPSGELNLAALQGKWSCNWAPPDLLREHKLLQIEQERLSLVIRDAGGKVKFHGSGEVKLQPATGGSLVSVSSLWEPDDTLVCI